MKNLTGAGSGASYDNTMTVPLRGERDYALSDPVRAQQLLDNDDYLKTRQDDAIGVGTIWLTATERTVTSREALRYVVPFEVTTPASLTIDFDGRFDGDTIEVRTHSAASTFRVYIKGNAYRQMGTGAYGLCMLAVWSVSLARWEPFFTA